MARKHLILCLALAFLALPLTTRAQDGEPEYLSTTDNDVQLRTGFELEKKFLNKFSVSWGEELRLKDNFKEIDCVHSDISVSYKATSWLKFAAAYNFISIDKRTSMKEDEKRWNFRHRISFATTFSYKTSSNWAFSLREKVQTTFLNEDDIDEREKSDPKWVLRSRIMTQYKPKDIPFSPYVYVELSNTLNSPKLAGGEYLEKVRTAIGTVYKFDKHSSIDFFYRFDYNFNKKINVKKKTGVLKSITEQTDYNNIFSVSYKYKF